MTDASDIFYGVVQNSFGMFLLEELPLAPLATIDTFDTFHCSGKMIGSWEYETFPSDFAGHPQDGPKVLILGFAPFPLRSLCQMPTTMDITTSRASTSSKRF